MTTSEDLLKKIQAILEDRKAHDLVVLPLVGKTGIADYMVIASGTSQRHLSAMADILYTEIHKLTKYVRLEGSGQSDWVLIDAGDVIVHLFREEGRRIYALEKLWG